MRQPVTSIKITLFRYLAIGLPLLWIVLALLAVIFVFHEMNESDDEDMLQLANLMQKVSHNIDDKNNVLFNLLKIEHDDSGFIIWNNNGKVITSDLLGEKIPLNLHTQGFIDSDSWYKQQALRVLYLHADDKIIAVAQKWKERLEFAVEMALSMLVLLLLGIPCFILFTNWALNRGFASLTQLTNEIDQRGDDLTPIPSTVPTELKTFINALNKLFHRVNNSIEQEQRFTADAAHELRSPLAAIKAQSEVLCMSQDRQKQLHHAQQIQIAATRSAHLIEQLLTLSRLDPLKIIAAGSPIEWQLLSEKALQQANHFAREKRINLKRRLITSDFNKVLPIIGDENLLLLLLRNLLDNAIRYSSIKLKDKVMEQQVELILGEQQIIVKDYGNGIEPQYLARIKERFFRPAGQNEIGSGLGLSIVERIGQLHNLKVELTNHLEGGLSVIIAKKEP